ncbi:MAG: Sensor protein [uncultured bacterium (gcode 4)]|uniref:Sensor protein n=1 Tax=uncultured bacterium (gcode 4) TaxID=1234023 RepID=K2H128_9BACT|nr:MAG: Sensor protein [uncultured bacterium (gcode 4)]
MNRPAYLDKQETGLMQGSISQTLTSPEYLEKIFEYLWEPVFVKDENLRLVFVNKAFCEFVWKDKDQIINFQSSSFASQKEYEDYYADDMKVLEENGMISFDQTYEHSSKWLRHVKVAKNIFSDAKWKRFIVWIVQDLTEQKEAEWALLDVVQKTKAILNWVHEGIVVYGPDLCYRQWNPFMEKLTWLKEADVLGKHPAEIFPFLVETWTLERLEAVLKGWPAFCSELRMASTDKTSIAYDKNQAFHDDDWNIIWVIGVVHDVTEHKATEEILIKNMQMYEKLVSKIPVWVYILHSTPGGEFELKFASPRMAEILGVNIDYLTSDARNIYEIIHPQDIENFIIKNREWIKRWIPFDWKGKIQVNWGVRWVSISSTPEFMNNWEVLWHWLVVDITENVKSEKELKRLNRTLKLTSDCNKMLLNVELEQKLLDEVCKIFIGSGWYQMSWVWYKDKNSMEITPVAQFWFEEWYLESIMAKWDANDLKWMGPIWACINERRPIFMDNIQTDPVFLQWREAAIRFRYNSSIALPLFDEEETIWVLMVYSEETEVFNNEEIGLLEELSMNISKWIQFIRAKEEKLKAEALLQKAEEQLRIRQKMDSLGTLASWISHDFNNLLTWIMGFLELLNSDTSLNDRHRVFIDNALKWSWRAADLIKQFQNLSRNSISEKTCIDIHAVAKEVFWFLEKTTDKIVEKKLDFNKWEYFINWSASEIHQVLLNLWTNSFMALEERWLRDWDFIRMRAEDYICTEEDCNWLSKWEYVHIMFEDNGKWMSEEVASKAFDPLFTTRGKSSQRGQWLGLSMVYNIIRMHKWHIHIESSEGVWTTMHIYLPKTRKREINSPKEHVKEKIWNETILVIEDEKMIQDFVKAILEQNWYNVITADDWKEWLETYIQCRDSIDAVVLDLTMPKMSGQTVLEKMLDIKQDVKVIISSWQNNEESREWILSKAKWFVNKPYSLSLLTDTVRNVLDS